MALDKCFKSSFYANAVIFLNEIHSICDERKINIKTWSIDHICYRVTSKSSYIKFQKKLSKLGKLLIESPVNGRPISTYKLNSPIIYKDRSIDVIELPFPKNDNKYEEGFEHIELVIEKKFDDIITDHPHLIFDTSSLNKKYNKELKLKLGKYQIKLHHQSLEDVIQYEKEHNLV